MVIEITYNGATLIVHEGQSATLTCAGKLMKTDVVISATAMASGVRLLTADGYALTDVNGLYVTTKEE